MKKIILFCIILLISAICFSQAPKAPFQDTRILTNEKTMVVIKGGVRTDSAFVIPHFADTTAANRGANPKYYPRNMIHTGTTGDSVWIRSQDTLRWTLLTGTLNVGGALCGQFDFSTSTSASDPGNGNIRLDNATYASVTNVYISEQGAVTDVSQVLGSLGAGDIIYMQDEDDASKFVRFKLSGAGTDNGTWWTMPVTFVVSGGSLFGNNDDLTVCVTFSTVTSTPTLQQVFDTEVGGSVLTKPDTISIANNTFKIMGVNGSITSLYQQAGSFIALQADDGGVYGKANVSVDFPRARLMFTNTSSQIRSGIGAEYNDSLWLKQVTGNITIDTLRTSDASASKWMVAWDSVDHRLYKQIIPTAGGQRFGKSGEDATAAENRNFDVNGNQFIVNNASTAQIGSTASTLQLDGNIVNTTSGDFRVDSAEANTFYTNTVSNRQGQYDLEPSFFQFQIKRNDLADTYAGYYGTINGSGIPRLEYFARDAAQSRQNWIQMRSTEIVFESETLAGATRRDYDFRIQHLSGKSSLDATDSLVLADETNGRLWKIAATDIGIGGTPTLQQVFDQETGEALMNKADTINLAANKMSVTGGEFFVDTLSATNIYDVNKEIMLKFIPAGAGSGDLWFEFNNANASGEPLLGVGGGGGNINFGFYTTGSGAFQFYGNTTMEARVRLFEDRDNGLDYAELKAPANISAGAITLTMPQLAGTLATGTQGTDRASSSTIALTTDGNVFEVTGTASVSRISIGVKENGFELTLFFTSTATLVDGTANSGSDIGFELNGNTDFNATAEDSITLVLSEIGGTQRWREKCRSVN